MLLQLREITKGYGIPESHNYRPVLKGVSLDAAIGDKIAIEGPSGSGKTTLLNLIGTLDQPEKGQVIFDGTDITDYSRTELAAFRNKNLGFIFQQHHLLPQLTLWENVLLPLLPMEKKITAENIEWAEYLIKQVGVWQQRKQKPSQLSGGECQRTAVVRALINKPQMILADEPTGALDEENASKLADLLIQMSNDHRVTLITVTHAISLANRMDKKYLLHNGVLTWIDGEKEP